VTIAPSCSSASWVRMIVMTIGPMCSGSTSWARI
jgi:hypothetical protein